jgi:hypothetical protein
VAYFLSPDKKPAEMYKDFWPRINTDWEGNPEPIEDKQTKLTKNCAIRFFLAAESEEGMEKISPSLPWLSSVQFIRVLIRSNFFTFHPGSFKFFGS